MIKEQLKKAIQEKDWQTVDKLQEIQDKQLERIIKLQEMRNKNKINDAQRVKILAEAAQINRKSGSMILAAIVSMLVSIGSFLKSFFK